MTTRFSVDSAAWLFEQLLLESGRASERTQIRRVFDEAVALTGGDRDERWWTWFVEASKSLGLKCKVIDATFSQLSQITSDGAHVIVMGGESQWLGLFSLKRGRFQVFRPMQEPERTWMSRQQLISLLGPEAQDGVIRCVVFEPQVVNQVETNHKHSMSPLGRLIGLLKPESPDIWSVVVFSIVTGILALATPLAVESLVNTVAFGRVLQPVIILALMLLAFLSFSAALRALQAYVVEIIQRRLFARVAVDLAYRLPRVEVETLDDQSGRELVNRFFDVVSVQKIAAQFLLDGISLIIGTLIGMAVLAFYHPWLLGFDVVLLALIAFVVFVLGRGAVKTSIKESKTKYQMAAWLENLVSCPLTFRHHGAADFALERADHLTYSYLKARKSHFRILMRQVIFALAVQAIASTVLLGMGGWLVMSGQLTLGQLVAAELIVTVIVGSFAKLGKHVESYYDLMASVDKLGVLFDLPMERQDGLLMLPNDSVSLVELNGVSCVGSGGRGLTGKVDLQIEPGDRMMLAGPSGSGKSFLLDILYGTRSPSKGHVLINGVDPRDLRPDALRRHVSLVREIEVFDGTISENIHLERPDVLIQEVRDAVEQVGLMPDILKLPDGLETHISETGYPLSSNQLRRLMLARAIVSRPSLLLIDGMVDSFSDDDAVQLTHMLVDPQQPWALLMVTGRSSIAEMGTQKLTLGQGMLRVVEDI